MKVMADPRHEARTPNVAEVKITWLAADGGARFARGRCIDLSQSGMKIEVTESIPVQSRVGVECSTAGVRCTALVRHCSRSKMKWHVGLEFTTGLSLQRLSSKLSGGKKAVESSITRG